MEMRLGFRYLLGAGAVIATLGAMTAPAPNYAQAGDDPATLLADTLTTTATATSTSTNTATASATSTSVPGPSATPSRTPERDNKGNREHKISVHGDVTEKAADSVTLKDRNGRTAIALIDAATKFTQEGSRASPTLNDVKIGMRLDIYGILQSSTPESRGRGKSLTSTRQQTLKAIVVRLPRVKERFSHLIGEITALSDASVTLETREGNINTGVINDKTKKLPQGATYAVGDRVLVFAKFDASQGSSGAWVVLQMVKLGPKQGNDTESPETVTPSPTASPTATATSTPSSTTSPTATATS